MIFHIYFLSIPSPPHAFCCHHSADDLTSWSPECVFQTSSICISGEHPAVVQSPVVTLWPRKRQRTRLPCPSPSPRVCSDPCPLSRWCHLTTSSSVLPFSSCLQSFPASGSFPMSWLFSSVAKYWSFSISPSGEYSGLIAFRIDWFDLLAVLRTLKESSLAPQHVRKENRQALLQAYWVRNWGWRPKICILTSSGGDSDPCSSLRTTDLASYFIGKPFSRM